MLANKFKNIASYIAGDATIFSMFVSAIILLVFIDASRVEVSDTINAFPYGEILIGFFLGTFMFFSIAYNAAKRVQTLLVLSIVLGCAVLAGELIVFGKNRYNYNELMEGFEKDAVIDSILISTPTREGTYRFKFLKGFVQVIDPDVVDRNDQMYINKQIMNVYPFGSKPIGVVLNKKIVNKSIKIWTINGSVKIYTDSLPYGAARELCISELQSENFINKKINYIELEGCIQNIKDSVYYNDEVKNRYYNIDSNYVPIIGMDDSHYRLRAISNSGDTVDVQ